MDHALVIERTECWVREVVVGWNLCPFAARPLARGRVRMRVCEAREPATVYRALLAELTAFLDQPEEVVETELFVVPEGLVAFATYLDLLHAVEDAVEEVGLAGVLQVAGFHPEYRFADAPPDDPANYTNRSPYPMFHLLREDLMERALAAYPDPEAIPQRNIAALRRLGRGAVERRLARCSASARRRQ